MGEALQRRNPVILWGVTPVGLLHRAIKKDAGSDCGCGTSHKQTITENEAQCDSARELSRRSSLSDIAAAGRDTRTQSFARQF